MANILTVYYSKKGQNYFGGSIKSISKGNTEIVAEMIQKVVGGDIFEIEREIPYPDDYNKCVEEAKDELSKNDRPKLKSYLDNLDKYDFIFVGYPNWCGTMPMVLFTFLEHYDLTSKKIIPFCTNEGSGMGNSEFDLKKICQGADVLDGLAINGSKVSKYSEIVSEWAKEKVLL
ncbi:flavodoxin [Intestinibacter sp.]